MNDRLRQSSNILQLFAGWCGLLLYVSAASPVGAAMAVWLGSLDRSHDAMVQMGADGMRVVLHHERRCALHRHGVVARTLTLFAEPSRASQPDHVLQFSASDSFSRQSQLATSSPVQLEQPAVVATEIPACSQRESFLSSVPTHLPPDESGQLVCLRSTLLLI